MNPKRLFKTNERINVYDENTKIYYKAMIGDVTSSGFLINQPNSRQGKLELKEKSVWEFHIESEDALYYFESRVLKRKKGATPLFLVEFPKSVRRQQRRQFFRLSINLEVEYKIINEAEEEKEEEKKHDDMLVEITEETDMFKDIKEFDKKTADGKEDAGIFPAFTVDISGGGVQVVSSKYLTPDTELLLNIKIPTVKDGLKVKGRVIRSFPMQAGGSRKYRTAIVFIEIDEKTREDIIQYIFDESRKRTRDVKV